MLLLESLEPGELLWAGEFWLRRFRQRQVVGRMSPAGDLHLPVGCQTLQPVLADGLEHAEAWLCSFLLVLVQQTFIKQEPHCFQHVIRFIIKSSTDCLYRL